jgi:hypothetical protein
LIADGGVASWAVTPLAMFEIADQLRSSAALMAKYGQVVRPATQTSG